MALEELEIKRDVEAAAEGISDGLVGCDCLIFISSMDSNPRCVLVVRRIDALVLVVFPLRGCLPEIVVTVVDITVVDGHNLIARNFYYGLFHDCAAKVLNYRPVGIFTIQRDFECQAGSPRDDDVMCTRVGEPNKQLLVLVNQARVVSNEDGLPNSFDPEGLTETPVRIKFTSEFARRSHGVFELTPKPPNGGIHCQRRDG